MEKINARDNGRIIKYGLDRFRRVLFDNTVQQRLSRSRNKRLTTLHANLELEGLVIDWHLADTDMVASNSVPLLDDQPVYAYA